MEDEKLTLEEAAFHVGQFLNYYENQTVMVKNMGPNLVAIRDGLQKIEAYERNQAKKSKENRKKSKHASVQQHQDEDEDEDKDEDF